MKIVITVKLSRHKDNSDGDYEEDGWMMGTVKKVIDIDGDDEDLLAVNEYGVIRIDITEALRD